MRVVVFSCVSMNILMFRKKTHTVGRSDLSSPFRPMSAPSPPLFRPFSAPGPDQVRTRSGFTFTVVKRTTQIKKHGFHYIYGVCWFGISFYDFVWIFMFRCVSDSFVTFVLILRFTCLFLLIFNLMSLISHYVPCCLVMICVALLFLFCVVVIIFYMLFSVSGLSACFGSQFSVSRFMADYSLASAAWSDRRRHGHRWPQLAAFWIWYACSFEPQPNFFIEIDSNKMHWPLTDSGKQRMYQQRWHYCRSEALRPFMEATSAGGQFIWVPGLGQGESCRQAHRLRAVHLGICCWWFFDSEEGHKDGPWWGLWIQSFWCEWLLFLPSGFAEQSVGQKTPHCINACMEQSLALCSHVMHASRVELLFSSHWAFSLHLIACLRASLCAVCEHSILLCCPLHLVCLVLRSLMCLNISGIARTVVFACVDCFSCLMCICVLWLCTSLQFVCFTFPCVWAVHLAVLCGLSCLFSSSIFEVFEQFMSLLCARQFWVHPTPAYVCVHSMWSDTHVEDANLLTSCALVLIPHVSPEQCRLTAECLCVAWAGQQARVLLSTCLI